MSFVKEFYNIYKEIIEFNQEYNQNKDSFKLEQIKGFNDINIPVFPLKLNPFLFNRLFSSLSTLLISENGNSVEIICNPEKKEINHIVLIKTDEEGNCIGLIHDPIPINIIQFDQLNDLDSLFDTLKTEILSKYYIDLGIIKIINQKVVEIAKEFREIDIRSGFSIAVSKWYTLIFNILENNWITTFPELPLYHFFKDLFKYYGNPGKFFESNLILKDFFNNKNFSLTLRGEDWYNTYIIQNSNGLTKFLTRPPYELGEIQSSDPKKWSVLLNKANIKYTEEFETETDFLIDFNWICEFLMDIFESTIPIDEERFKYLLQKFLYGIKEVETVWDSIPKSQFYDDFFRLRNRMGGLHISPRKISYWAIPELLIQGLKQNFGINSKIIVLLGQDKDNYNSKIESDANLIKRKPKELKNSIGIMLNIQQASIKSIKYIDSEEINNSIGKNNPNYSKLEKESEILYPMPSKKKSKNNQVNKIKKISSRDKKSNSQLAEENFRAYLKEIHLGLSNKYGFINNVIFINTDFINDILKIYTIDLNSKLKNVKNNLSIYNKIKKSNCFSMYPELPLYQYFKTQKTSDLIKKIAPLFFDFQEF